MTPHERRRWAEQNARNIVRILRRLGYSDAVIWTAARKLRLERVCR